MNIKIAIADDHSLIAEGIAHMLRYNADMELIAEFKDGAALLQALEKGIRPDVLLLDISMPGIQGDELAGMLKAQYPGMKIIALTSHENIFYIKSMLQQNIEGYLLKHINREILTEAIAHVYNGGTYLDETVDKLIQEDEAIEKRQRALGSVLTKREREILQLIAGNLTSAEIAEKLFLSKRTVEHHRENILFKLDVKKTSALIKKAVELNLLKA